MNELAVTDKLASLIELHVPLDPKGVAGLGVFDQYRDLYLQVLAAMVKERQITRWDRIGELLHERHDHLFADDRLAEIVDRLATAWSDWMLMYDHRNIFGWTNP